MYGSPELNRRDRRDRRDIVTVCHVCPAHLGASEA
jgi:hypothetical protein